MTSTLSAVGPVLIGFLIGVLLRRAALGDAGHGQFLLALNLYVCMPALVFPALATVRLEPDLLSYPAAAALMVAGGWVVGRRVARHWRGADDERAVVTMSFMVVNCAFAVPFVDAVYGPAGVARVAAFDLVHNLLVLTVVQAVAVRAGAERGAHRTAGLAFLLRNPAIYAAGLGAAINAAGWSVPAWLSSWLGVFGGASLFVVAIGSGLVFGMPRAEWRSVVTIALVKPLVGVALAGILVLSLPLGTDLDRGVMLMLGVAPLGFVVVTFAAAERLATRFAASTLGVSLVVSLVLFSVIGMTAA